MARIIGERIVLREYQESDFEHIRKWVNNSQITDKLSDIFLYPHTETQTRGFLDMMMKGDSNMKGFVIAHKEGLEYIGQIDLISIDWRNRIAEMGIVIGLEEKQGKGYGSEAIKLLLDFVFNTLNLNKMELIVHDYNQPAIKCYKSCGFIEEGRKREKFFYQGRYTDHIHMGILKREYLEQS